MSPARRRRCIDHVREELPVSERRICRVLGQHRSTQRKVPRGADDEEALTADIIELARQYGRYGYRRVTALDLALCLRMHLCTAHMAHLVGFDIFRQFTRDVAGTIVTEQPWLVLDSGMIAA